MTGCWPRLWRVCLAARLGKPNRILAHPLSLFLTRPFAQRLLRNLELSGPITQKKSDVFLALEKRAIDEFQGRRLTRSIRFGQRHGVSVDRLTRFPGFAH
jgi:hypothetical protein